jgi:hypothetical protein
MQQLIRWPSLCLISACVVYPVLVLHYFFHPYGSNAIHLSWRRAKSPDSQSVSPGPSQSSAPARESGLSGRQSGSDTECRVIRVVYSDDLLAGKRLVPVLSYKKVMREMDYINFPLLE